MASGNRLHRSELDQGFKPSISRLPVSSVELEENWASRDISRFDSVVQPWRIRLSRHLYYTLHGDVGFSSWLLDTISQSTSVFIVVAQEVMRPFDKFSESAVDLIQRFKTQIASTYDWGGNELTMNAAMSLILAYLHALKEPSTESELHNAILQLYRWIVKVVINRELSSSTARLSAARLLQKISSINHKLGDDEKRDTALDSQIKLLRDVDMEVRFWAADSAAIIFLSFPVSSRVSAYREIVDCLETDELHSEAFAMRAYTLMQLAIASDDIRRAALVNLLELGKFESCKGRVRSCFAYLADRLYLGDPKQLYSENCSQFICSWIDFEEDIFQFPFYVFGFDTFGEWSAFEQSELTSQLINAGLWDDASSVYLPSIRFEELLSICLPQIVGDFQLLKVGRPTTSDTTLDRCEAALGSENYRSIVMSNFALSLSIIIERLDDRTLEAAVLESLGYEGASRILTAVEIPRLNANCPDPPQPAFNLQTVILAVENHCRLIGISSREVWSPGNANLVLRRLLDRCRGSFDSTIQRSHLRRIWFVLSLSGVVATEPYVLEMLLFGITELAENPAVSRDAFCILKYLCDTNVQKLAKDPSIIRCTTPRLLHSLQRLKDLPLDFELQTFLERFTRWLLDLVNSISRDRADMRATCMLVQAFTNPVMPPPATTGTMIKQLILDDSLLWEMPSILRFALRFLSYTSNICLEPTPILEDLVKFFLKHGDELQHDANSMVWLGSAIGAISKASFAQLSEKSSFFPMNFELSASANESTRKSELISCIIKFGHWHPEVAGALEQSLRRMAAMIRKHELKTIFPASAARCIVSSYISNPTLQPEISFSLLSDVSAWTSGREEFPEWFTSFVCSLARDFDDGFYSCLIDSIIISPSFRRFVFPLLVHEHQIQKPGSRYIVDIFNTLLSLTISLDRPYLRLITDIVLFLRERASKIAPSDPTQLISGIDYFQAARAAISCKMYKAALLFLELSISSGNSKVDASVRQILSDIYSHLQDPDLTSAVIKGIERTWDDLPKVYLLHHQHEGLTDLRRARLRGKIELGFHISQDDDDLLAVSNFVRKDGFPLPATQLTGDVSSLPPGASLDGSVYGSAWRLGIWDLPPLLNSEDIDSMCYSVVHRFLKGAPVNDLLDLVDVSIVRSVKQLIGKPENPLLHVSLRLFSQLRGLFDDDTEAKDFAMSWGRQIIESAKYGRYQGG
jgi:serine-protein kinase ATM